MIINKVTDHERDYLITLEMKKKGIKVPKKQNGFGENENIGFKSNMGRMGKGKAPLKPARARKYYKFYYVANRAPVKAGLSIVGSEMEIHSALESRENMRKPPTSEANNYRPPDQYPTFEQLMKMASLKPNIQINKK